MTKIRMQIEDVREVCYRMEQTVTQFYSESGKLQNTVNRLDGAWEGSRSESYLSEFRRLVRQIEAKGNELESLSLRVNHEVDEWEYIGQSFGLSLQKIAPYWQAASGQGTNVDNDPCPRDTGDLARLLMDPNASPIRIYQTGPNEYMVLIQGTNMRDPTVSNNWGAAIQSGLGLPTDYSEKIAQAMLLLPAGSVFNLVGHSQGGIVANNLANDPRFDGRISTVTTFGSPVSSPPKSSVKKYTRYAAEGDIVPYLEGRDAVALAILAPFLPWPMSAGLAYGLITNKASQTEIPGSPKGFVDDHFVYANSDKENAMEKIDLPFTINHWSGDPKIKDDAGTAQSGLAVVNKDLGIPVSNAIQMGKVVVEGAKEVGNSVVDGVQHASEMTGNFFAHIFVTEVI